MLIKRNTYFSAIDQETGEERLFSVNEILDEETYLERLYSETKENKKKNPVADKSSYRGNGRAYLIAGNPGIIGRAVGNHVATKAAKEGAGNKEVMERGTKAAGKTGAVLGAVGGLVTGPTISRALGVKGKAATAGITAGGAALSAGLGYAGAKLGAKKAIKERIIKRKIEE
jgi:hypothetical protein